LPQIIQTPSRLICPGEHALLVYWCQMLLSTILSSLPSSQIVERAMLGMGLVERLLEFLHQVLKMITWTNDFL
jgi:hypothetical protein